MRRGFQAALLGFLLSFSMAAFARAPLQLSSNPSTFSDVQSQINQIAPYLAGAQCGGWNMNQPVGGVFGSEGSAASSAFGTIAKVTGVPGHQGKWNGDIKSGMATRVDDSGKNTDFQYPQTAMGLTTACLPNKSSIEKKVWRYYGGDGGTNLGNPSANPDRPFEVTQMDVIYPHPQFKDPSCRWRRLDTVTGKYSNTAPSKPLLPLNQYNPPPVYNEMQNPQDGTAVGPSGTEPGDRQSATNCVDFCTYVNSFQYLDCATTPVPMKDLVTGKLYLGCPKMGLKYLCTDQPVTSPSAACSMGSITSPEPGSSRTCAGNDCRCSLQGQPKCRPNPGTQQSVNGPQESAVFYSYFRMYLGSAQRATVISDNPIDQTILLSPAKSPYIPVSCFGFYNEFDPLTHQTQPQDRRCVIDVDVSMMRTTQIGKGEYGQKSTIIDTDPESLQEQRSSQSSAGSSGPLWNTQLGWGISFLNEKTFHSDPFNQNLTNVFSDVDQLDRAKMKASWPVNVQGGSPSSIAPHVAISDLLRSFDDTGKGRVVVRWWQKQATEVTNLVHPAVVRLLLPPGYAFGVDPTDPIFGQQSSSSSSAVTIDRRSDRIDVQIDAKEDMLGDALNSIQNSLLLHLEEEPVPVIVPFGSPEDFRIKAQAWCSWYMSKNNVSDCDSAPAEVKNLISRLNTYADDIEQVRSLRSELASYAGEVFALQRSLTQPISDWVSKNITAYSDYLKLQQQLANGVTTEWNKAQTAMDEFTNVTNLPWCMNQRFETPIYSLLDQWLPSRSQAGKITADNLPNIQDIPRPDDIIIDFSHIAYMTGALRLPVLKPVQIALDVPSPKDDTTLSDIPALPALPSLAGVATAMDESMQKLPKVQPAQNFPPLKLPSIDSAKISSTLASIQQITDVLQGSENNEGMIETYDNFWQSIGPLNFNPAAQPYDPTKSCGSETIKNLKEQGQCCGWNDRTCQNVEMDLLERFQRIDSRKLVMLKDDYTSTGALRLAPDTCLPTDQTCLMLHGESPQPKYQWQINQPKKGLPDLATPAKKSVRDSTLPQPVGAQTQSSMPTYDVNPNDLLPVMDIPRPIDLMPTSSSSSSS